MTLRLGPGDDPPARSASSSRIVFRHPFLQLVEDTVQLPSGGTESWIRYAGDREGPRRRGLQAPCANGPTDRRTDGRLLVSRQWCLGPQPVVHELPGGGVDTDESLEEGVRRELQEEVGLWPHRLEHLGAVLADNRKSSMRVHIYLASNLEERALPADGSEVVVPDS